MATLAEIVQKILEDALADGRAELETLENGHVCGHVISSEFDGQDYEARRLRVRQVLEGPEARQVLASEDALRISTLLTYTPEEWSATLEEA